VTIETHNAQTGETYSVDGVVMIQDGIKPGSAGLPGTHGTWKDPENEELDEGPNVNKVFPSGPGYIAFSNDQSFHVRAKVEPKGGDN